MKQKELRKELILSKLSRVEDNLNFIEDNFPETYSGFSNSRILRDATYKEIESSIEFILDVCHVINRDLRLGIPESDDGALDNLEKNKVFSKKFVDLIRVMKRFRNILVHKYGELDDKKAFNSIKNGLEDFNFLIKEIKELLKKV